MRVTKSYTKKLRELGLSCKKTSLERKIQIEIFRKMNKNLPSKNNYPRKLSLIQYTLDFVNGSGHAC